MDAFQIVCVSWHDGSSTAGASEAWELLISSCIAEVRVFASTRDFFKSSTTCSLVFSRWARSWASLFSSSISLIFFPLNQLPALHSAFSVPGKPFQLIHSVEQASSTVSHSHTVLNLYQTKIAWEIWGFMFVLLLYRSVYKSNWRKQNIITFRLCCRNVFELM